MDVCVNEFPDFFVLAVEFLAELIVVKGFKVFYSVVDQAFGEDTVLRENFFLFLEGLSGLVAGSRQVFSCASLSACSSLKVFTSI